jgi:hypothetical protein
MTKHKITIHQRFLAERTIEVEVEADDRESALEEVNSGAIDTPDFDDPRWKTSWKLQEEFSS